MQDFRGKTAVITGGATGIGFALAKQFGAEGANIVIGEPRQDRLNEAVSALRLAGYEASAMAMDVTDPQSMEAFAAFAWEAYGAVHVLVNNAGIGLGPRSMVKQPLEDMRRIFDVNVFGVWHGSAVFGRRMIDQGEPAAIYNLGSENSFFNAVPKTAAYIASKHAVRGLTEAMRDEFPDFITIGLICPGFVKSELTPPPFGDLAMETDLFAAKTMEQIKAGAFYIVSHAYNVERFRPVHDEIEQAYAKYAPRYEGDEEYDVRTLLARVFGDRIV